MVQNFSSPIMDWNLTDLNQFSRVLKILQNKIKNQKSIEFECKVVVGRIIADVDAEIINIMKELENKK